MTVHTPSNASEAQGSKNAAPSLQALWQTPADRASVTKGTPAALGPRDRLRAAMLQTLAAHVRAAEQACTPADAVFHLEEARRLERELYAHDVESEAERTAARTARHEAETQTAGRVLLGLSALANTCRYLLAHRQPVVAADLGEAGRTTLPLDEGEARALEAQLDGALADLVRHFPRLDSLLRVERTRSALYTAAAEHERFEASAQFEHPGPWRVVPGSWPGRWDVLDAHGLLVAAERVEAVAELRRVHLTTEDPLG